MVVLMTLLKPCMSVCNSECVCVAGQLSSTVTPAGTIWPNMDEIHRKHPLGVQFLRVYLV